MLATGCPARGVGRRSEHHGGNHRDIGQAKKQGSEDGKGERIGHGGEHLAADTRQKEDGREDDQDDQLPEKG